MTRRGEIGVRGLLMKYPDIRRKYMRIWESFNTDRYNMRNRLRKNIPYLREVDESLKIYNTM